MICGTAETNSEEPLRSLDDFRAFVAQVAWAPSTPILISFEVCWDIEDSLVLVRLLSTRPDRETGTPIELTAGGAYIHCPCTPAECLRRLVECLERVYLHELCESFLFAGARILDPHLPLSSGSNLQPSNQERHVMREPEPDISANDRRHVPSARRQRTLSRRTR